MTMPSDPNAPSTDPASVTPEATTADPDAAAAAAATQVEAAPATPTPATPTPATPTPATPTPATPTPATPTPATPTPATPTAPLPARGYFEFEGNKRDENFNLKPIDQLTTQIPEEQRKINHEVYAARNILKLLKDNGRFRSNEAYKEFIDRVVQAGRLGGVCGAACRPHSRRWGA